MKLHLPVRLFRAVVSLMVAVPIAASAAYTAPTEILIPDNNTEVKVDELSDISSYASNASAVTFRIDATAFPDGCFTISSQKSALKTDASGSWCFVSDSADDLATLIFSGSSTRLFHAHGTKGLVFSDLKELAFKSNSYKGNGVCIYGASVFRNNVEVAFINNASTYNSTAYSAGGGAINGYDMEFVDNKKILFEKNFASHGGAICVYASTSRQLSFRENETISFDSNDARYKGGAIFGDEGCSISFSENGAIVFESNYASGGQPSGGAVYLLGDVELNRNKRVEFKKNYVSISTKYDSHYAEGGGVYASSVLLNENDNVLFENNYSFAVVTNYAAFAHGGGIYASNLVELSNNKAALFSGNHVGGDGSALGGAIYAPSIVIEDNTTVEFSDNYAISEDDGIFGGAGGAIYSSSNSVIKGNKEAKFINNKSISGGAIYGNIIIAKNDWLRFENNVAQNGGALYGTLKLTDNQTVEFRENNGSGLGGALYSRSGGSIVIANNKNVLFEKNCETKSGEYCLRSIYLDSSYNPATFFLSAPLGGKIEFRDSVALVGSASSVFSINDVHVDDEGIEILQLGDVIFTGEFVEQHLKSIKGDVEISTSEMTNSLTTQIEAMTHLYDGRLIIRDGVVYKGYGITVHNSHASGPTLYLKSSTLDQSGYDVTMQPGSVLELEGSNSIKADFLDMKRNCSFTFHVVKENAEFSILNLIGCYKQSDTLTLNISFNDATAETGLYKLMTVTSIDDENLWSSSNVTVNGLDGYVVSFDDLEWKDNTLYLNYNGTPGTGGATTPTLLIATWTNEAQDGMWNSTSLNWEQDEVDYAYVDDVQVVFGDEGAGTVTLVGIIAPSSVLVDSAEDYTWNADETEGGKLTGDMTLTKKGEGKLTINTENDYTGGTQILGGKVVAGTATALGSGVVSLNNAGLEIIAENFANVLTTAGVSSIVVKDDGSLKLSGVITNAVNGTLTLSGKVDVSGIGALTKLDATLIDVNGNAGESGFTRAEGYTLQVVQGGKVLGSGAELVHSDLPTGLTLVLGENGLAMAGAATDFTKYVVAGSHAVSVSEILKDVPTDSTLSCIEMSGGTLLVDAATDALSASAGTVTMTRDVELAGTMSGGMLLAQAGEIAATLSGSTGVVASGTVTLSGNNSHTGGVMLNGGALTLKHAQTLGSGPLVTSGTSSLVIGTGVELALGQAISNSGSLSISGSIDASGLALHSSAATRVDVNGVSGTSGFAKDALEWVQIVNGGTTVNAGAEISHNSATNALVLGSDGRATGGGVIHHDAYLLNGTGVADVQRIMDVAGAELTSIEMQGGTLTVNADTAALLEATDGIIMLETGGTIGSGSSVSGVDIKASGGSIAAILSGSNTLEGIGDFALNAVIANDGTLVLSGNIKADALSLVEETPSTFVDVNGAGGTSGFSKSAQMSVQLASGTGTTIDGGVTISHKDATETLVLDKDGKAGYGGVIDYSDYLLNGEHDSASVSGIIADAGDALNAITVQKGTLMVDAVTKPVTATGGEVVLDGGVLNGSLSDTTLTLKNGSLGAVSISGGSLIGSDYAMSEVLQVSGEVSISGSFNASSLQLITDGVSRVDVVIGNSGNSGFLKYGDSYVQLINGGELTINGATVKHGTIDLTLGADGYARTEGKTDWSTYLLTGTDKVNVGAVLDASADAAISMNGGELTVDLSFSELTATGGKILLNTDVELGGAISGSTIHASAGTLAAALSGNNTLVGDDFALSGVLNNSGTLTLSGSFTVSTLTVDEAATYIGLDGLSGTSGFTKSAYQSVEIATGTTADAGATIKYGDTVLSLNTDGTASAGGEVDMGMFYLNDGSASTSAIHTQSALADVTLSNGTLTVDDTATVSSTGGAINLNGGTLNGSVTDTALTLTSGAVNASICGGSLIGSDYALSEVLQVSGEVSISGSFNASSLQLITDGVSRVDVVTGNSGNSGFLKYGDSYVQLINGGELTVNGATVKHGTIDLTLGADGYARTEGKTDWSTYLLTGTDKVNVGAVLDASADAAISMNGGALTVDRSFTDLRATGGKILLNTDVELGGAISGSTIQASAGTLAAGLSDNNTLVGDDFALSGVLNNSGTLTLSGSFTVSALTVDEAATYIGLDGLSGTSGFAKSAYQSVEIATGTTADAGATIKYGDTVLSLNTDGTASSGGEVDMSMYYLNDGSASTSAIHTQSALADVTLSNGTLTVDDTATVTSTGGAINLNGGTLNGSVTDTALTLTSGAVNASISGGSLIGSDYALSEVLQVSGEVSISGSFNASSLQLITDGVSRVDVVTGNSGNSGFLKYGDSYVQLINGGELTVNGATVKHGTIDLTLGADGYARTEGKTDWSTYLLTGTDKVNVGAVLDASADAAISMNGGALTVDRSFTDLRATGGKILLNTDVELGGNISGSTIHASAGTLAAALSGNNTLVGDDFALSGVLNNSGTLTLSGSFTVSALTVDEAATYIGLDGLSGTSGFAKSAYQSVEIATGTTADAGATIKYGDTVLSLNTDGTASAGGEVDMGMFYLNDGSASTSAIHTQSALADVTLSNGTLTVDDTATVTSTGGAINLNGGTLNGSVTDTALTLTSGAVNASISGGSLIGSDYSLSEVLQVSGEVSISGSFNASSLQLITDGVSRVDVVTGNSGNSGFLKYGDSYVQLINGGELTVNGATVKHGTIDLTLGADGYARTEGKTDWSTYLLTGTDKVNVGAVLDASADAAISMNGGELTVDRSFSELTATGGKILLNTDVVLGGVISGSTIHVSAGTLAAALSGNNTLVGDDFALSCVLNNSGTLTLSGSFTVSALTVDEAATYIGLDGLSGTSGFAKSAYQSVEIATGTTADAGATIKYGDTVLSLNTDGTASAGGEVDMGMFYLNDGSASTSAIHTQSALADVTLSNGTLTVDDTATVSSTGGAINLNGGTLNGSVTNTALTLTSGTVNASISGGSLIGSDYAMSEVLQVSGEVSISGSFNASSLQLITDGVSRIDVVTGNSGNSGFLKYGDSYVQLINGGELTINGATVKHGTIDLTLGADGYARTEGKTDWSTYLLTGSDKVSTLLIHSGAGAGASVRQEGGQLTVDDETTVKTTGGEIVLSGAILYGEVSDARITAEGGCIAASLDGITAVTITNTVSMSGNNSHSGVTTLADGSLTITNANALGSGDLVTTGESKLTVDGVTLALSDAITNTGKLTLSGSIDASALQLNKTEAGRLSLSGERVGLTESGFSQGVEYTVLIVDGGSTVNAGAGISHKDYLSRTQLVLGEDGVARAGAEVDYTHFFLTGGDSAEVSKIAEVSTRNQVELNGVTMDSGLLTVDQSITVSATGGSISITDDAVLSGTVEDTAVSTAVGDYSSEIAALLKGDTTLEVNGGAVTVSGDNSYSGGTTVNGGKLVAGSNTAFGSGDVAVNDGGTLDLGACIITNRVLLSGDATLAHADGASNILMQSGANADFANGFELSAGKSLTVGAGMVAFTRSRAARVGGTVYRGALTLGGGELTLNEHLTVEGYVNFGAGTTTIVNVAGWQGAEAGTELASFSSNSGYTEESLTLRGAAAGLVLNFDAATGVLSLVAAQQPLPPAPPVEPEFVPNLNRNQQEVYDTVKDIVAGGEKPEGELGKLVELISGSRNEAELRELLDAVGGSEYATLMSSQIDSNLGHMRNLRSKMGQGWQLVGNNYMRAMIEMFGQQSELDADGNGRGYKRNETGGQFTLEFIGCTHMSSGVAVAASRTKLTPDNALEQTIDNAYVDFYTSYRSNGDQNTGYSAKFSLGVGMHDYKLKRNVLGMQAEATTEGFSVNFMHESAYAMSLTEESSLQVFGVLESSFGSIEGFRENGLGTASLMMDKQNAWTTDMTLGLRYIQMFESLATPKATLTLQGGITATAGDTTVDTKLHFTGAQQHAYTQHGAKRGRLGYNLGFNLHMPMDDTSAVYCHGETILRSGSTEWNANIGYQVAF